MKPYIKRLSNGAIFFYLKTDKQSQMRINIGVKVGCEDETDDNNGICHFIEHMMFTGTKTRDAKQINFDFENIGAESNAFTTKTFTCYYASCLPEKAEECADILSDMLFNTTFDDKQIEKERKVIYNEIDKNNDNHSQRMAEEISRIMYQGLPFSRTIIGTKETLKNINRDALLEFYKKNYIASNFIVTMTAPFSKGKALKLVNKYIFEHFSSDKIERLPQQKVEKIDFNKQSFFSIQKDVTQDKLQLSFSIDDAYSSRLPCYEMLCCILGGGASSRLFCKIREDLGLVYSIYSSLSFSKHGGLLNISLGTSAGNVSQALCEIKKVLQNLIDNGITQEELDRAKIVTKTDYYDSLENNRNIVTDAISSFVYYNKYITPEDRLKDWGMVTLEQVNEVARDLRFGKMCAGIVSNINSKEVFDIFKS